MTGCIQHLIDDPDTGGSYAGAWVTAIAHTPHLAAQAGVLVGFDIALGPDMVAEVVWRDGKLISATRTAGFPPPPAAAARVGGAAACAPEATNVAPRKM